MRIHHLHIQHRIDPHLNVVARDANLFGDVDRDFLEAVPVGHPLDERNQDVKAGLQCAAVLAQMLDDVGALLRHHHRGFRDHDDHDHGDDDECVAERNIQETLHVRADLTPLRPRP